MKLNFEYIHTLLLNIQQVAKYVPQAHAQPTNESVEVLPESGQRLKEVQMDDDLQVANSSNSSSETLDEPDIIHVVGDIVHVRCFLSFSHADCHIFPQLIPANTDDMRQQVYTSVSGAAVNSNKDNGFFEVKAAQYTSHYKNDDRSLSTFPVRAHFNTSKYKNKIPIPFDNTYVSVEGFLESIETDDAGHATMFHMSVDNINFLGRANPSPSKPSDLGKHSNSISFSKLVMTSSLQDLPLPRGLPGSNTILKCHLQVHPLNLQPVVPLLPVMPLRMGHRHGLGERNARGK